MLKLNQSETTSLLTQPETGMGYQLVEATLRDNRTERGVVFNAELLFLGNETRNALWVHPYAAVLRSARSSGNDIRALRVLPRETAASFSAGVRNASGAVQKKAAPAKDAAIEKTSADEVFKRFSAYEDDKRRRPDGSWYDGTPESGMGYQRVDIRFANGRALKDVVVLNAEDLEIPDEFAETEIWDVSLHS